MNVGLYTGDADIQSGKETALLLHVMDPGFRAIGSFSIRSSQLGTVLRRGAKTIERFTNSMRCLVFQN